MEAIVRVDEHDLPWADYTGAAPGRVRVKAITPRGSGAPPVQYVEYAPGHRDGLHRHDEDEVFLITAGEVSIGDAVNGPGSMVFIPRHTEYEMCAGTDGVRFFRVVTA